MVYCLIVCCGDHPAFLHFAVISFFVSCSFWTKRLTLCAPWTWWTHRQWTLSLSTIIIIIINIIVNIVVVIVNVFEVFFSVETHLCCSLTNRIAHGILILASVIVNLNHCVNPHPTSVPGVWWHHCPWLRHRSSGHTEEEEERRILHPAGRWRCLLSKGWHQVRESKGAGAGVEHCVLHFAGKSGWCLCAAFCWKVWVMCVQ